MDGSSQHNFMKGKSCFTRLITFCNEMISLVNMGRAVDVVYLGFSKAFDSVFHNILIDKVKKCRLGKWTVRQTENWPNGQTQKVVVNNAKSSWRPITPGVY